MTAYPAVASMKASPPIWLRRRRLGEPNLTLALMPAIAFGV